MCQSELYWGDWEGIVDLLKSHDELPYTGDDPEGLEKDRTSGSSWVKARRVSPQLRHPI